MSSYQINAEARYTVRTVVKVRHSAAVRKLVERVDKLGGCYFCGNVRALPHDIRAYRVEFESGTGMDRIAETMQELIKWLKANPEDYEP